MTDTSSMGEIPGDIQAAANECVRDMFVDPLKPMTPFIARAILAERERCAAKVDYIRELLHSQHEVLDIGREDEAYRIAAEAIRKGGDA